MNKPRGALPRVISPNFLWTGGCLEVPYQGEMVHVHMNTYLIMGSDKTLLVDTGHPIHWPVVEKSVDDFLKGRPLDYIFLTHAELPHMGLLPHWMAKFPDMVALGDIRDYALSYPDLVPRMRAVKTGDEIDLGDRKLVIVPAVWRDMPSSLWAFETSHRVLFVADGFGFFHYHSAGQCDFKTSEHPPPDVKMLQFFNERSLQWTKFMDAGATFSDIDRLFEIFRPQYLAGAHNGLFDGDALVPLIKSGMMITPQI